MRQNPQSKNSPIIELNYSYNLGLIILDEKGTTYSNITGGIEKHRPERKGFYVPFGEQGGMDLKNYWLNQNINSDSLSHKDIVFINSVLRKYRLLSSLRIDRGFLHVSEEAWVFTKIIHGSVYFQSFQPYPRMGILTWPNTF